MWIHFPEHRRKNFKARDENLAEWIWKGWVSNLVKLCLLCIFSHCLFTHPFFNTPPTLFFFFSCFFLQWIYLVKLLWFKSERNDDLMFRREQQHKPISGLAFACLGIIFLWACHLPAQNSPLPSYSFPALTLAHHRWYKREDVFHVSQHLYAWHFLRGVCHHFRVLASLWAHSSLASTPCDSTWNMHTFLEAAGCHLRVIWNASDGRPECCRPILWIFDGLNEQEKYRTKHFVGSLNSRRVRNNGRQERMKYWKLYSKRKKVPSFRCCLRSMKKLQGKVTLS